jgi:hypothetical protein
MGAGECQDAPRATARGQRVAIPGAQEAVGVELEVQRLPEQTICRDAISFGEDHEISRHHLSPRDASTLAVTDHQRARAGEIPERLERMLRACLNDGARRSTPSPRGTRPLHLCNQARPMPALRSSVGCSRLTN